VNRKTLGKAQVDLLKSGPSKIPPPATRDEASDTLSKVRDVQDRRRIKKTGRVEYMGVRVQEQFKERCVGYAAELTKLRGGKKRVTLGELLEVMADSYALLGEVGAKDRELVEKIAGKMKIEPTEVLGTLVALKAKDLGLIR
jgi:hypothetical protein